MNKKIFSLILIVVLAFSLCLLCACNDDPTRPNNNPPDGDNNKPQPTYWGKLSGIVTENDKPIQGVKVTSGSKTATTDVNGKYEIEIYDDGAKVVFTKDGYITQTNTFKSSSFSSEEQTYNFIIFRAVKVSGTVVDANGLAVSDAVVTIGIRRVNTDSNGRFVMDDVIGTSMMVFASKGKQSAQKPIFTEEMLSGAVEIELVLR